jgi:hypothetical protein
MGPLATVICIVGEDVKAPFECLWYTGFALEIELLDLLQAFTCCTCRKLDIQSSVKSKLGKNKNGTRNS